MNIYLAAKYERKGEMRTYAQMLQEAGMRVTSSWVFAEDHIDRTPENQLKWAACDLFDINSAHYVLLFTGGEQSPGRNFEFGYAYATNKKLVIIGPKEGVFHYFPGIENYSSLYEFIYQRRI